jgi:hypothetical protein
MASVVMAASVLAGPLIAAAPADASIAPNGATWYRTTTTCDVRYHQINRVMNVLPQPGWRSQYVSTRTYLLDTNANIGAWGPWHTTIVYANDSTSPIGGPLATAPAGGAYRLYTSIRWWNGSNWSAPVGAWDDHWVATYGGTARSYYCLT